MGETALEIDENEAEDQDVIVEEDQTEGEASLDDDGNPIQEAESSEVDIVLDEDEGSQLDKQLNIDRIVRKRVSRLNTKHDKHTAELEQNSQFKDQKIQLLELALDQKNQSQELEQPDPTEFDDGANDPKYVKALQTYNQSYMDQQVKVATADLVVPQSDTGPDVALEAAQTRHYKDAQTLGIKDYDETEDKAINILGKEAVNQFILNSNKSHLVLYHLGKNLDLAEEIAELIKTLPVKATLQFGALGERLKVKPRRRTQTAPDPDEELQGGSSASAGKRGPKGATYS